MNKPIKSELVWVDGELKVLYTPCIYKKINIYSTFYTVENYKKKIEIVEREKKG